MDRRYEKATIGLTLLFVLGCAGKTLIPQIEYTPVFVDEKVNNSYRCVDDMVYNVNNQCLVDCTKQFGDHILNMDFRSFVPYAECLDNQKDFYKNHVKRLESKIEVINKQIGEMR